ncbi:alanine dehydrogenase [Rhodococcus triatomae]|uniref:Alanine dehydrogenase n=1 Tax=Rhodococcus triatomae TaxID=300028 RepID=A0A1G8IK81_9NOCA|nr:N(5)-(carboxyethyl)ornithine synthase [Rhodococcus triatomae]QNG21075.1 alanine dehydrogenase [Rhodococcus triatomae]QNG23011.1 alanine dehydrogenase [Rhodococcus triatomae]SDI19191.1 Alanine dehydrogenase [Rhodococcus triatomae]
MLDLGVLARSRKENERRLPIHPTHLPRLDADIRAHLFVESGYGEGFGVTDEQLSIVVAGVRPREQLVAECDVLVQPKPDVADLQEMRTGQILWGWPHCVQDPALTQVAIDRDLTLIAFEAMNHWNRDGSFGLHVFHKNNELAGYCSVLHALQLAGSTGDYGRRLRAVVIGFGATARGAVTALNAHGVDDVRVLTSRKVAAVGSPIHSARIVQAVYDPRDPSAAHAMTDAGKVPIPEFLAGNDIVVNCVLQDPTAPLTFLTTADLGAFAPRSLLVDVSCDEGMGFDWARPTTFDDPAFVVGDGLLYYAVDHSPSYLWESATWEISDALIPHLRTVLGGPDAWATDETIARAIEIRAGVVLNPDILTFQGRSEVHPHPRAAVAAG